MGEITPDVEALHMIIGLGNFESLGSTGGNTYDLAQRTSDLAQRIMSSDWLEAHDREVAEKAWDEGWKQGSPMADSPRIENPYREGASE